MAIKGLHGFRYCILTNDDVAGFEYETEIKRLIGARSIKVDNKVNDAKLYGDDQLLETASAIGSIDVDIDVADLTLEQQGELLGYKYENGVLTEDKDFNPPYIAFGFVAPKSNGGTRMVWLLKGKMQPISGEGKTQDDKVEFQTQKAKFIFMPRVNDGKHKHKSDTDLKGAPTEEEFFSVDFLKTGKKPVEAGA
ncbi:MULTISPECIES: major tail protein [Clostridium]|uniref:Phage major tail, phi13 family protein n=1 Tax=Clostridium sporogenes TaxID=1509 RepID=A0A1J1CZ20_CLOSG|nr:MULTISPECIES: major tail protein [Clostridium]APF27617.1 phage major tail, phi13 family protein [Clostridium sporogenes]APH15309.1 phage major tail, phi13 family protein [Clostridium sporogenes]MBY6842257.1 phage tail protein [Clostridium botulinum]MBY6844500.1 phage tail protein [Clostridium botulinum]NFH35953.1 phage tail protein [Clostridium botulinum]